MRGSDYCKASIVMELTKRSKSFILCILGSKTSGILSVMVCCIAVLLYLVTIDRIYFSALTICASTMADVTIVNRPASTSEKKLFAWFSKLFIKYASKNRCIQINSHCYSLSFSNGEAPIDKNIHKKLKISSFL